MAALLPRLFGDMSDWFEMEFPRPAPPIRFEDKVSDKEYVLRAELPGLEPDKDVQISTHDGVLTIKAERREEEKGLNRSEFRYGMVHRSVRLPANADEAGIKATYRKGILEVIVPLTAPAPTARQIEITTGE
ncbi:Hsp20/alpha crystallin family protein [Actinoplanes sp. NPDC049316]|uniref:Hsp20/alpha crystallin family protein n=1 Tax=Actinoplanes sp. NPDC049316 TaxID=3154727 RepID=UPI003420C301